MASTIGTNPSAATSAVIGTARRRAAEPLKRSSMGGRRFIFG